MKKNVSSLLPVVCLLLCVLFLFGACSRQENPDPTGTSTARPNPEPTMSTQAPSQDDGPVDLGSGLFLMHVGKYAGIFMEDGTDQVVSDTMMIIVKNNADKDLQLARISMEYKDFTAEYETTNLPAGESVVLLERSRHKVVEEEYREISTKDVVFFQEPMSLMEETLKVTGGDGYVEVTNISSGDITGDIYVYYKNIAADILYGGITYRAKYTEDLQAGQSVRILTGHYNSDTSTIVQVVIAE